MDLKEPIKNFKGIGLVYLKKLAKIEIKTIKDLLYHAPTRYIDYSLITTINTLQEGETVTLQGEITQITNQYIRKNLSLQKAILTDKTGSLEIVWFNQPYLCPSLLQKKVNVSGKVTKFGHKLKMESPEYEVVKQNQPVHTGYLVPVYPETKGLSSKWLRAKIAQILPEIKVNDPLPYQIRQENKLLELKTAFRLLHQPKNQHEVNLAQRRFAFEELFYQQLIAMLRRQEWQAKKLNQKLEIKKYLPKITQFVQKLPFKLTAAQKRAAKEILTDLAKETAMNRLLQGDVGCGKTVVAAIAIYACYLNQRRSILMAPTEILAMQHYQNLQKLFTSFNLKVALKTSSHKKIDPAANLIVGTHALLYEKLTFDNIALVVIDEQHRFGVEQRAKLKEQKTNPHLLTMTATPIPRTIALTIYGDLDISIIDQMPAGRKMVKTWVVPPEKYQAAYSWISRKIQEGRQKGQLNQVYIIYPLIEESEILKEVKAAKKEYEKLKKEIFPNFQVDLLHGKLSAKQKNQVIEKFRSGQTDILVATSVVEVGMDIPQANIMIIENADRFGLAQLHQLRGRIGRNQQTAYCFIFSQKVTSRLKALEKYHSGLKLAEIDLKIRGAGEIYGTKQHGLSQLKFADFQNLVLIEQSRQAAEKLLKNDPLLVKHPLLKEEIKPHLTKKITPD